MVVSGIKSYVITSYQRLWVVEDLLDCRPTLPGSLEVLQHAALTGSVPGPAHKNSVVVLSTSPAPEPVLSMNVSSFVNSILPLFTLTIFNLKSVPKWAFSHAKRRAEGYGGCTAYSITYLTVLKIHRGVVQRPPAPTPPPSTGSYVGLPQLCRFAALKSGWAVHSW